jgi:hypothetical protein
MSSLTTTLQSPRFQRRLFWLALLVLAAGIVAVIAVKIGNRSDVKPVARQGVGVKDVSKVPNTTKLNPQAKRVAQEFILTAVARKNLRRAWDLAGPQIKQGQSLKQWLTGDIAVVPYPIDELKIAPMKIDYSYANEAAVEIALVPKDGAKVKPLIFYMDLVKQHGKWVVNSWVPRSAPEVPLAPSG